LVRLVRVVSVTACDATDSAAILSLPEASILNRLRALKANLSEKPSCLSDVAAPFGKGRATALIGCVACQNAPVTACDAGKLLMDISPATVRESVLINGWVIATQDKDDVSQTLFLLLSEDDLLYTAWFAIFI